MPLVNIGAQRTRSRVVSNSPEVVNSIGIGTANAAEALADNQLGAGAAESSWKHTATGATLTDSTATDGAGTAAAPWWQLEATWGVGEFNGRTVFEIGTGAGSLNGENPAAEDGTRLYTRKRVGGAVGLGKTADYSLVARVRVTYPSS
jgi:hypothetical protein